jgi:hypothetical protein
MRPTRFRWWVLRKGGFSSRRLGPCRHGAELDRVRSRAGGVVGAEPAGVVDGGAPSTTDNGNHRWLARLRLSPRPDGNSLQRQADLRRDEPRRMVVVLRPDVPHDDDRAIALDRPTRLLGRGLERRSVLLEFEPIGQRHVERFRPLRTVALGHPASLALRPARPVGDIGPVGDCLYATVVLAGTPADHGPLAISRRTGPPHRRDPARRRASPTMTIALPCLEPTHAEREIASAMRAQPTRVLSLAVDGGSVADPVQGPTMPGPTVERLLDCAPRAGVASPPAQGRGPPRIPSTALDRQGAD